MAELLLSQRNMDVDITNDKGEREPDIEKYVSQVVESSEGVKLFLMIPANLGNLGFQSLMKSCEYIKFIDVKHYTPANEISLNTRYKVDEFYGWEMSSDIDTDCLLRVALDFSAQPVQAIEQDAKGIAEWLEEQNS